MYGGKGDPYEKGDFGGLPPPRGDLPATGLCLSTGELSEY